MITQQPMNLGMDVRVARTLRRLRQDQLADEAGATTTDVSRLERGRPIAQDRQARILAALGLEYVRTGATTLTQLDTRTALRR